MAAAPGQEKRRAARIKFRPSDHLEVRYKFLSHLDEFQCDDVFKGVVENLSKGGALFMGAVPGPEWLPPLGQGQVLVGMNVITPDDRIKALASLRWTRPVEERPPGVEGNGPFYELGVQFEQIDPAHRNVLNKFLIGHQLRTRKFRRADLSNDSY